MPPVILAPYITRDHEIRYGAKKSAVSFSGCMSTDDHTEKLYVQSHYMRGWNLYMFPGIDVYDGCACQAEVKPYDREMSTSSLGLHNGWACNVRERQ